MFKRPRVPKDRIAALLLDWAIWGYLSYCSFFLINYLYESFVALSVHDHLSFPAFGWPAAILGSLIVAVLWEAFGTSIGQKAQGLVLVRGDLSPATSRDRIRRAPLGLFTWIMAFCTFCLLLAPLAGFGTLFYGLATGTCVSFLPGVTLWAFGAWSTTLLRSLASVGILLVAGSALIVVGLRLLGWLWGTRESSGSLADRQSGVRYVSIDELGDAAIPPKRWFRTSSGIMAFVLIAITLCVGWLLVDVDFGNLIRRAPFMARTLGRLVDPDFSTFAVADPILRDSIGSAMVETIFMALMATLLGLILAFPLSFLGARNLMGKGPLGWAIYTLTRAFFNIFRSVEVLIWAIIFAVWVSFGPFAGVIALAIHTVAALGKLYSEQVESIDPGPVEAMTAVGARRWQIIIYGIIPQIIPSFMAFTMYRWDINVRMSTIIGLVGGGGIGRILFYYKNELEWEKVGAVVITIIAVVWTMDYISGRVRERIS
jgi:phosphonate ABC transporter permease subunit PhnE